MVSATVAGAVMGAGVGALGSLLPADLRIALATVSGLVAVVVGLAETLGRRVSPPQCDRETPQRWVGRGPIAWAVVNGAALALGFSSRIGFALWYTIPVGAVLMGDPIVGAVIWAAYGAVRAAGAGVLVALARGKAFPEFALEVLSRTATARGVAASWLLSFGVVVELTVGL